MTGMRDVGLVAKRELRERARSASFLATTAVMVLIVVFIVLGPSLLQGAFDRFDARLVGTEQPSVTQALDEQAEQLGMTVRVSSSDLTDAEQALQDGDVDAVIEDGRLVVWKTLPNDRLATLVSLALGAVQTQQRAADLGLTVTEVQALMAPAQPAVRYLEPPIEGLEARRTSAMVGMVVLFTAINMFGNFVLTAVVEDKASRVVEVLLSRVPPHRLLAGKILGIGTLGAGQLGLIAAAALIATRIAPAGGPDIPSLAPSMVAWLILWFVLGYAFYSSAYAAAGALASRMEDAQSAVGPLTLVMVAAYFFTFLVVQEDASSALSIGASYVPITSPLVMPMRLAVGAAPLWEGVLAAVVMALATYGLVAASGRVYRGAVLRVGARVRWSEAWRAGAAAIPRQPEGDPERSRPKAAMHRPRPTGR